MTYYFKHNKIVYSRTHTKQMSHGRYKIEVHAIRFVFYANSLLLLLLFYIMKLTIAELPVLTVLYVTFMAYCLL